MWDSKENYPKVVVYCDILYRANPDPDFQKNGGPGLTKRRTLSQNLLY